MCQGERIKDKGKKKEKEKEIERQTYADEIAKKGKAISFKQTPQQASANSS